MSKKGARLSLAAQRAAKDDDPWYTVRSWTTAIYKMSKNKKYGVIAVVLFVYFVFLVIASNPVGKTIEMYR